MNTQTYLIDTNVIVGLEDNHSVRPAFAALTSLASKHNVGICVHEAAQDDIARDKDTARRDISLSKLAKFQLIEKRRGLTVAALESEFGVLAKPNDVVDATLLHALLIGVADFVVTEDKGLHDRARRHSPELQRRVLFVPDAVQLLRTTYEPVDPLVRYVEEVPAHPIPDDDEIFESLREGYPGFSDWWRKCIREKRQCWIVNDGGLAGLVVRKDENQGDALAVTKASKIFKICTFKVRPEKRGVKLGELLLKKIFWFAQANKYDLVYLTTKKDQVALITLLLDFGFKHTTTVDGDERVYEKSFSSEKLSLTAGADAFEAAKMNYPRFITDSPVRAFGVPIKEAYHDTLYPDLKDQRQTDLFNAVGLGGPKSPGNTIRKVYICRAPSKLGPPGSILLFYKGKSSSLPSQAITVVGILESVSTAKSTKELMVMTGGRSVYSETQLKEFNAERKPVKVINFLLVGYIEPPIGLAHLQKLGVFGAHPPQSIWEVRRPTLERILPQLKLGFLA